MSVIFNVGNRMMNTYVYNTSGGYIMVDTGYEHSLVSVENKLKKADAVLCWHGYFANVWQCLVKQSIAFLVLMMSIIIDSWQSRFTLHMVKLS